MKVLNSKKPKGTLYSEWVALGKPAVLEISNDKWLKLIHNSTHGWFDPCTKLALMTSKQGLIFVGWIVCQETMQNACEVYLKTR